MDVSKPNVIEGKPYYVFNLRAYKDKDMDTLIKFDKRCILIKEIIQTAQEGVFTEDFEIALFKELAEPTKDLLKIIH